MITSVEWSEGKVRFIDQTLLPAEEVMIETSDYHVVADGIRKLKIRGAPAIGVAASFALLLAVDGAHILTPNDFERELNIAIDVLSRTRPTAVNLFTSLDRMRRAFRSTPHADIAVTRSALHREAHMIQQEDIAACKKIGEHGAALITPGSSILTHCNTGSLATAGEGTAQSVITTAAREGKVVRVYVDETRPLFQGARLTSWELLKHNIDAILITDSTAGYLMQQRKVSAVIVGADRIAANGDTANKIGTYTLAVLAERHGVPFYVAAPTSTIDHATKSGNEIQVEERNEEDVTHVAGSRIAAKGVSVYAPAFDVTPGSLITAIITEAGVLTPPFAKAVENLQAQSLLPAMGAA